MDYRCEVVTPAGRKRYIEILYKYLYSQKQDFDVWQLWVNTTNTEDINYMKQLERENSWIRTVDLTIPCRGSDSIYSFFPETKKEDTIYIRLDDDIVYLSPNFIRDLKKIRIENPKPLFIYPNIINNAIISHIHYRNDLIKYHNFPYYDSGCRTGWRDPKFCEVVHNSFLDSLENSNPEVKDSMIDPLDLWRKSFNIWTLNHYERVSINCVTWFGSVMKDTIKEVTIFEEVDIACDIPKKFNNHNIIVNGPICAHYAFFVQRDYIDNHTDILERYRKLSDKL